MKGSCSSPPGREAHTSSAPTLCQASCRVRGVCDAPDPQAALENGGHFLAPLAVTMCSEERLKVAEFKETHFCPATSYSGGWMSPPLESDGFVAVQLGLGSFQHPRLLVIIPVIRITSVENGEES